MAIGDLVLDNASPDEYALVKATASSWDGVVDARSLIRGTPFKGPDGKACKGLAALLEQYHGIFTYGTEVGGVESVAVPFSHVFLLPGNGAKPRERTRADIVRRMEDMWKRAIDPLLGARADFLSPPDYSAGTEGEAGRTSPRLDVFFGSGVFVPPKGAHPAGRVEVEFFDPDGARRGQSFTPLGPMIAHTERNAAFYIAQSALAFAVLPRTDSPSLPAPAVVRIPQLTAPVILLLAPGPSPSPSQPLQLTCLQGSHPGYAARRNMPPNDGDDVADEFQVTFEQSTKLLVRYRADIRPSRLRRRHRPGRFAISGIIEPRAGHLPLPDHWWVDLDDEDVMLGSALVHKARSIAVRSGSVHCYDWEAFAEDRSKAALFSLESVAGLRMLRFKDDDRAFGYLERPAAPLPVSFDPKAAPDSSYTLDWIDLTAAAEIDLEREGLGTRSMANGPHVVLGANGSPTAVVRATGGILYRAGRDGIFERREEVPWQPGGQIVLEPFCLTMLPDEEAAA
jgi:hypothetical protein